MNTVMHAVRLPVRAQPLWAEIGAFGSVGEWHPLVTRVDSEGDSAGSRRTTQDRDGVTQVDRLKDYDGRQFIYRYEMISTTLPVRDYVGEFRVDDNADETSTVTWSANFALAGLSEEDGERTAERIRAFIREGTEGLRRRFERVAADAHRALNRSSDGASRP